MTTRSNKRKVLLMGKSGSGKTSMRSIIFANYIARDTMRLGPTLGVENSHVRFLGNLILNLWDCGGQDAFMENYFESQRDSIFRHVEVLIYVFDIESADRKKDMDYFDSCLQALRANSKTAHVFCLIHKMDLIRVDEDRARIFEERRQELLRLAGDSMRLTCFATSIWDETLYKAWSSIVYSLVPNVHVLEQHLAKFCALCHADEVVLFEKATFLVISSTTRRPHADVHRYEKISNIIKQFKLSCSKSGSAFESMEVRNQNFVAFVDVFTSNTYVMIVSSTPVGRGVIASAVTSEAARAAQATAERLLAEASASSSSSVDDGDGAAAAIAKSSSSSSDAERDALDAAIEQTYPIERKRKYSGLMTISSAAINLNIQVARPHFERFLQQNMY